MDLLEERFWSKVSIRKKNECWEWQAGSRGGGYGTFKYEGKAVDSHRMTWFIIYGEFPDLWVLHKCDNRKCCNPSHLFLGTYKDNIEDMIKKGRTAKGKNSSRIKHSENYPVGENFYCSKLKENDVREIRKRLEKGESCEKISEDYPVVPRTIREIKYGKTWKSVL